MRIAFFTDLHTNTSGETPHGVDVRKNFQRILQEVKACNPDYIWIGGDLCFKEPRREIYEWQHKLLEALEIPYRIIAGNHDESRMLCEVFVDQQPFLREGEMYWSEKLGDDLTVFFLDSSQGMMSRHQKAWLSKHAQDSGRNIVLIHHPPSIMHIPFMDNNHRLRDHEEVLGILQGFRSPPYVLSGHYHVDKCTQIGQVFIRIVPSCYFQLRGDRTEFAVDHYHIAFGVLDVYSDRIETTIRYLYDRQAD